MITTIKGKVNLKSLLFQRLPNTFSCECCSRFSGRNIGKKEIHKIRKLDNIYIYFNSMTSRFILWNKLLSVSFSSCYSDAQYFYEFQMYEHHNDSLTSNTLPRLFVIFNKMKGKNHTCFLLYGGFLMKYSNIEHF